MLIFLGSTLIKMGFVIFWIVLWRLKANNGERANGKLALYFCMSTLLIHSKKIKVQNQYALSAKGGNRKLEDIILLF